MKYIFLLLAGLVAWLMHATARRRRNKTVKERFFESAAKLAASLNRPDAPPIPAPMPPPPPTNEQADPPEFREFGPVSYTPPAGYREMLQDAVATGTSATLSPDMEHVLMNNPVVYAEYQRIRDHLENATQRFIGEPMTEETRQRIHAQIMAEIESLRAYGLGPNRNGDAFGGAALQAMVRRNEEVVQSQLGIRHHGGQAAPATAQESLDSDIERLNRQFIEQLTQSGHLSAADAAGRHVREHMRESLRGEGLLRRMFPIVTLSPAEADLVDVRQAFFSDEGELHVWDRIPHLAASEEKSGDAPSFLKAVEGRLTSPDRVEAMLRTRMGLLRHNTGPTGPGSGLIGAAIAGGAAMGAGVASAFGMRVEPSPQVPADRIGRAAERHVRENHPGHTITDMMLRPFGGAVSGVRVDPMQITRDSLRRLRAAADMTRGSREEIDALVGVFLQGMSNAVHERFLDLTDVRAFLLRHLANHLGAIGWFSGLYPATGPGPDPVGEDGPIGPIGVPGAFGPRLNPDMHVVDMQTGANIGRISETDPSIRESMRAFRDSLMRSRTQPNEPTEQTNRVPENHEGVPQDGGSPPETSNRLPAT